jgi:hypothetical protein
MREIKLTKGQVTLVDDEDYERLAVRKWHAQPSTCGFAAVAKIDGKKVLMSRVIMNAPDGVHVDHKDGNRLNNQKSNLRFATVSQNQQNKARGKANTSGYKGVMRCSNGKYNAYIYVAGKRKDLGRFTTAKDGARAYDAAALEYFGEFAMPNFPPAVDEITDEDLEAAMYAEVKKTEVEDLSDERRPGYTSSPKKCRYAGRHPLGQCPICGFRKE